MVEKYRLKKTVQDKGDVNKVITRQFTTFTQPLEEQSNDTVMEFFRLYDKLYLDIPLEGVRSHTYLIEQSSKLIQVSQDTTDVQPLLDEISDLRQRVLEGNERISELETQNNNGV